MTEQQATYRQALRASEIVLNDKEVALAFELAKAVIENPGLGLREWAQVHTRVNAEYAAKPVERVKEERHWVLGTFTGSEIEWPKAC